MMQIVVNCGNCLGGHSMASFGGGGISPGFHEIDILILRLMYTLRDGAIYNGESLNVTFHNRTFEHNYAENNGGAIYERQPTGHTH